MDIKPGHSFGTIVADTLQRIRARLRARFPERFSSVELRQLQSLTKAYAGPGGPEILIFGDSAMFWTRRTDADRRNLVSMVKEAIGGTYTLEVLAGPGYNPRIVSAFLHALSTCPGRPRVVVVPTSLLMATKIFLTHPAFSYEVESEHLIEIIDSGAEPKHLRRPEAEAYEELDRLPVPSLYGARRTVGEVRLMINSTPETRWQKAVRLRHMYDMYNGEVLEPDSMGVRVVSDLGTTLTKLELPSIAYIPQVNLDVIRVTLGDPAVDHIRRNAEVVEAAYLAGAGSLGTVVNAVGDSPAADFHDPVHLDGAGREKLARRIAAALEATLKEQP